MKNYTEKLKKLEIIANKILAIDSTPVVKLTHICWIDQQTPNGVVELPQTNHFGILIMGDEVDSASTFNKLQEKLINILTK